ncbi:MAG: YdcF family protein [Verrucomicrobiia bacterium]
MSATLTAIVVLGAPNDERGVLSSIAKERCDQALKEYRKHPECKILPTGGWGAHFNTTTKPHGHYLRECLTAQGIPGEAFVECAESANTIEDAKLCRPIVARHGFTKLIVVTSDFHVARTRFLFEQEFPEISIEFSPSHTHLPQDDLRKRILHEESALAKLKQG